MRCHPPPPPPRQADSIVKTLLENDGAYAERIHAKRLAPHWQNRYETGADAHDTHCPISRVATQAPSFANHSPAQQPPLPQPH